MISFLSAIVLVIQSREGKGKEISFPCQKAQNPWRIQGKYESIVLAIASCLQICHAYECTFIILDRYVLQRSVNTWAAYRVKINGNSRCSLFVCCVCLVKLPCLTRYTVGCSVWIVSCRCISTQLCFVTALDFFNSSFTFFTKQREARSFTRYEQFLDTNRNLCVQHFLCFR